MNEKMNDKTVGSRANVILWLFSGCFLIFAMVIVGGITRLTGSGLSITEWKVVTGTIPPLNEVQWQEEFEKYQQSPQFKKINAHFELTEFKNIYWWEYIHRLLGRLIGLVFIIPFIWFLVTRQLDRPLIYKSLLLFFLGGLQGFIGWYMVSSGLVDIPNVSHYRLALHLLTAFITFGLTYWFAIELFLTEKIRPAGWIKKLKTYAWITFCLIVLQIIYGAFVAGLKAGYAYNTWPLMGDTLIPSTINYALSSHGIKALTADMSVVQFIHRYLAYIVYFIISGLWIWAIKKNNRENISLTQPQVNALKFLLIVVNVQFLLGVLTLIYAVPIWLGVLHQVGAFLLFAAGIYLMHCLKYRNGQ